MKLAAIFLTLSVISSLRGIDFTVKDITSGITFVNEARALVSYQKWNIVYYYHLIEYIEQISSFETILNEMQKACNLLKLESSTCLVLIIKFEKYKEKIEHSNDLFHRYRLKGKSRPTRSLLPILGTVLSALIGTTDEDQANLFNERITQLEKEAKNRGGFNTERLSIIQSSLVTNDKRFKELTSKIITLNSQMKNINSTTFDQIQKNLITDNFNYLVHTATLTIIDHIRMSDLIMQLLTNSISNKITELIPVNLLQENLREITFGLAKGKRLPFDIDRENIYELFDIVNIKTAIIDNKLMIILSIPIVNDMPYNLFKVVPIPTQYLNEAIIIQPSTEYILVNKAASHYIPITANEYTKCLLKQDKQIICTPIHPIYLNKHSQCEFCMFDEIDMDDLAIHCKHNIQKIPNKNYFIKLQPTNHYYAYIKHPLIIRFYCAGKEPEELLLSNHGVLKIDDYCVMKTDGLMIEATHTIGDNTIVINSPNFNASVLAELHYEIKINQNKIKEDDGDVTLIERFDIETNELFKRIEQIKEEEQRIEIQERKTETNIYFTWINLVKIIMTLIIITIIIRLVHKVMKLVK